jgi:hypothetical protein
MKVIFLSFRARGADTIFVLWYDFNNIYNDLVPIYIAEYQRSKERNTIMELSFGIEPRETAYLLRRRLGFDFNRHNREALLVIGRCSWLLTW